MPLSQTYPNAFGGVSRVQTEMDWLIERVQGYAVLPAVPVASLPLIDINSTTGAQLSVVSTVNNQKVFLGAKGVILGNPALLSGTGTLKVGNSVANDFSSNITLPGAVLRDATNLNVVLGTSIASGTQFIQSMAPAANTGLLGASTTSFSVFGANNETAAATPLNISSSGGRCLVLITLSFGTKSITRQALNDYPQLPKNIRELVQVSSLIQ